MDAHQPAPPLTRPPDGHLIHNPNHQPPTARAFAGYPPSTQPQQPQQPQQPLHVPFATSTDPYATSRRDPFLPQTSHDARQRSHGAPEHTSQAHTERSGGWGSTGMHYSDIFFGELQHSGAVGAVSWTFPVYPRSGCWSMSKTAVAQLAWRGNMERRGRDKREDSSRTTHLPVCCRTRRLRPPQDLSCGLNFALLHTSPPVAEPSRSRAACSSMLPCAVPLCF